MTTRQGLRVMLRDERFVLGQRGRMIVAVTTRPPTGDSIGRFVSWLEQAKPAADGPLVGVIVPSAKRPAFDAEAREAARQMWSSFEGNLHGVAVWIRHQSFIGALQRSLVTAVLMIQRANIPNRVVASAAEAIDVLDVTAENERAAWAMDLNAFAMAHDPRNAEAGETAAPPRR
ncbi:MAG: hypothetical protein AAGA54_29005 [Myxococcota bacterium]